MNVVIRVLPGLSLAAVLSTLAACYESPTDVTLHSPHVYKGQPDPHEYSDIWQRDRLRARLHQVQTDR
jgi:hypothetical protein